MNDVPSQLCFRSGTAPLISSRTAAPRYSRSGAPLQHLESTHAGCSFVWPAAGRPGLEGRSSCRTQGPGRRTAEGRLRLCLCCASPRVSTASREEESMGFYLASCVSHPFESIQRWKLSVLEMGRDRPNHWWAKYEIASPFTV